LAQARPLQHGFTGDIRKLWASESMVFLDHLLRLDAQTRRNRFGTTVTDEFLTRYATASFGVGGIAFGYFEDGVLRGAAELRGLDLESEAAEAAFSVEDGWRQRGIGAALFQTLITSARNRRHGKLYMTCLKSNEAMQALARKFSASVSADLNETEGLLDTGQPTAFTILDEAMSDAQGFAVLSLDLQRKFWQRKLLERKFWQGGLFKRAGSQP
jgi:GNAT superfamily N-acetyltransferase